MCPEMKGRKVGCRVHESRGRGLQKPLALCCHFPLLLWGSQSSSCVYHMSRAQGSCQCSRNVQATGHRGVRSRLPARPLCGASTLSAPSAQHRAGILSGPSVSGQVRALCLAPEPLAGKNETHSQGPWRRSVVCGAQRNGYVAIQEQSRSQW